MNKDKLMFFLKIAIVAAATGGCIFCLFINNDGFLTTPPSGFPLKSGFFIMLFNLFFLGFAFFANLNKIKIFKKEFVKNIFSLILFCAMPFVLVVMFEGLTSCTFSAISFAYSVLLIFIFQCIFFMITRSMRYAYIIAMVGYFIFLAANDTVVHSRGIPILPQDILSAETAATVSGHYSFFVSPRTFCNLIFLLACAFSVFRLDPKFKLKKFRVLMYVFSGIIIISGTLILADVNKKSFIINTFDASDTIKNNGIFMSFLLNYKNMSAEKPQDYDKVSAKDLFEQTANDELTNRTYDLPRTLANDYPNVIVIMNESFSDLGVLGKIEADTDCLENFNKLKDEGLSGKMLVSVLGGNTANTEFEFLTGLSMAFLPNGSVPYTQYVDKNIPTLATWLGSLGYKTIAFHPFYERCWKRNYIYPLLGFDDFISIEDISSDIENKDKSSEIKFDLDGQPFGDFEYVRGLLSDGEDYRKVEEIFEEKDAAERVFIFNVTIQNHGGYNVYTNGFENTVKINTEEEYTDAEQYLSLIKRSDEYLKELTDYFREKDEPVLIIFFGDHQPWLSKEFYEATQKEESAFLKKEHKYTVPYLIWSNKALDKSKERKFVSPNFLAAYALEAAGIEQSSFQQFLNDLSAEIPAVNYFSYKSPGDNVYHKIKAEEISDKMVQYRDYQYYTLFEEHKYPKKIENATSKK